MPNSVWGSDRLVYRNMEQSDEAFLLSVMRDPYTATNMGHHLPAPTSIADIKDFLDSKALLKVIPCLPDPAGSRDPAAMTAIGFICLFPLEGRKLSYHRSTTIGIGLAPEYQNKRYGGEIILWALEWAFKHAGLHRVVISTYEWNTPATRLYPRLGFRLEGREVKCAWHEGRWWDHFYWAMLYEEWLEQHGGGKTVGDAAK